MKIATRKACPQRRGEAGKINPIFQKLGLVTIAVSSIVSAIAFATPVTASTFNFSEKLTAPDGAAEDFFGNSVAIDGDYTLIGSYFDDDNGTDSGSAYLFDIASGSQLQKFIAPDGAAGDYFGESVAIDGNYVLIGSRLDDDNGIDSGSAYLFEIDSGNLLQKFIAPDGATDDSFGWSVAIDEEYALIGSIFGDGNIANSGAAYVFDITNGQLVNKLTALNGAAEDFFGSSVAIDGDYALIGSTFDDDNGNDSGSAYLFDVDSGAQLQQFIAPDGAAFDNFGNSVAIDGDYALIGSTFDDDNGTSSGSAYLFDIDSGNLLQKFIAPDGTAFGFFGSSVSIDGDHALIGSYGDDENGIASGSAYLFDISSGDLLQKLSASDGAALDFFGWSADMDGDYALIGSWRDDDNGSASGSAYLFTKKKVPESSSVLGLLTIGTLGALKRFLGKQK